jgi:hypothetical protein
VGVDEKGTDGSCVGGIWVSVGRGDGEIVGSGMICEVGKLVVVGIDVSVGITLKVLHDVNAMTRNEMIIALQMIFTFPFCFLYF